MADLSAVMLAVASTIAASAGMIFFKLAAKKELDKMIFSFHFIAGGALFVFGTILMILALKMEELSLIFPVTSLTYIWVMILSRQFLGEKINKWKIYAVMMIVAGIVLAGIR